MSTNKMSLEGARLKDLLDLVVRSGDVSLTLKLCSGEYSDTHSVDAMREGCVWMFG